MIPDTIKARDVYDAKHIAKRIKADDSWDEAKMKIMKTVITLKFDQSDNLRDRLLNLKGHLYEATKGDIFPVAWSCPNLPTYQRTKSQEKTFVENYSANTVTIFSQKNKLIYSLALP